MAVPRKSSTSDLSKKFAFKPKALAPKDKLSILSDEIVIESDTDDDAPNFIEIPNSTSTKKVSKNAITSRTEGKIGSSTKESSLAKTSHPTKASSSTNASSLRKANSSAKVSSSTNGNSLPKASSSTKPSSLKKTSSSTKVASTPLKVVVNVSSGSEDSDDSDDSEYNGSPQNDGKSMKTAGIQESEASEIDVENGQEHPNKRVQPKKIPPPSTQALAAFKLPMGFKPASLSTESSSLVPEIFSQSNLKDKEIWHITVPANVSIGALEETSLKNLLKGNAVFHYKDTDYGFAQGLEHEQAQTHVLVPDNGNDYRTTSIGVSRSLHLRQLVQLPALMNRTKNPVPRQNDLTPPKVYKKSVRQQPKGLKRRYQAFGDIEAGSDSVSENEATVNPSFKAVPRLEESPVKKRKNADVEDERELPEKKSKRRRKDRSIQQESDMEKLIEMTNSKTGDLSLLSEASMPKGAYQENHETNETSKEIINGAKGKHRDETREERAKRKEEKKRRKERRIAKHGDPNGDTPQRKRKKHSEENIEGP